MARATFLFLLALALGVTPALSQQANPGPANVEAAEQPPDVVLKVDGLACPFCAAGLERKLKALDATAEVEVKLEEGEVYLTLKAGETVTDATLTRTVENAGFSVRGIDRRETDT